MPESDDVSGCSTTEVDRWPLRSYLELGALPTAVPWARWHARQVAWEWGIDGLTETIELLVSELVTNAVKATAGHGQPVPVRLRLSSDEARLLIEVWDGDPRPPMPKYLGADGRPALEDEGGRGLFLVEALSERWSWYASREWGGKVVWCELGAPRPDSPDDSGAARQILLPRRTPGARDTRPVQPMDDSYTLRRVRDGLRGLNYAIVDKAK